MRHSDSSPSKTDRSVSDAGAGRYRLRRWIRRILFVSAVVFVFCSVVTQPKESGFNFSLMRDWGSALDPATEETLDSLKGLEGLIQVTAFSSERMDETAATRDASVRQFLGKLSSRSPIVETRFINMDTERDQAQALRVVSYGTILVEGFDQRIDISADQVFKMEGKGTERKFRFVGEVSVGRAISQILTGATSRVYLLVGHGEPPRQSKSIDGLDIFIADLEAEKYRVRDLDLRPGVPGSALAVPEDANVVLMVGPAQALSEAEAGLLAQFVEKGGALGVFLDPGVAPPGILEKVGLTLPPGFLTSERGEGESFTLSLGDHAIAAGSGEARPKVWVSRARSILVAEGRALNGAALLLSSTGLWNEVGGSTSPRFDPNLDVRGPFIVGVATSWRGLEAVRPARLVVIGDSDFLRNGALDVNPNNALFAINVVRWLASQDELLGPLTTPSGSLFRAHSRFTEGEWFAIRWGGFGLILLLLAVSGPLADFLLRWRQRP